MLLVHVDDLLDFFLRAQVDTAAVVDVLRHGFEETLGVRVNGQTAGVFEQHGHGGTLVQDTQLTLGALGIRGIGEETTVKQSSVGIGNHATDVTGTVGLLAFAREFERVEVFVHPRFPVHAVTLIDRVDTLLGGHLHVGVGQDEFSQRVFHGEAVDCAVLQSDDQLRRGTIHGETRSNHLRSGAQDVLGRNGLARTDQRVRELEDTENGANRDACVQVRRAVDGVADHGVASVGVLVEHYSLFEFLRNQDTAPARALHSRDEDVISNHIQLLLVVTRSVGGTGETGEVNQGGPSDVVGNGLERELKSVAEETDQAKQR